MGPATGTCPPSDASSSGKPGVPVLAASPCTSGRPLHLSLLFPSAFLSSPRLQPGFLQTRVALPDHTNYGLGLRNLVQKEIDSEKPLGAWIPPKLSLEHGFKLSTQLETLNTGSPPLAGSFSRVLHSRSCHHTWDRKPKARDPRLSGSPPSTCPTV